MVGSDCLGMQRETEVVDGTGRFAKIEIHETRVIELKDGVYDISYDASIEGTLDRLSLMIEVVVCNMMGNFVPEGGEKEYLRELMGNTLNRYYSQKEKFDEL